MIDPHNENAAYRTARKEAIFRLQERLAKRRELSLLSETERRVPRLDLDGLSPDEWLTNVRNGKEIRRRRP